MPPVEGECLAAREHVGLVLRDPHDGEVRRRDDHRHDAELQDRSQPQVSRAILIQAPVEGEAARPPRGLSARPGPFRGRLTRPPFRADHEYE
jgi:hypothetical protein